MFGRLRSFVLALSGAHQEALEIAPSERARFEILGAAILVTSCLAVVSMWFALADALSLNGFLAVPVALGWGLAIMGIQRWLVTSMPVNGRRKVAMAVPRLLLALLLGTLISAPLVLRIFQTEIDAQIAVIRQGDYNSFLQEHGSSQLSQQVTTYDNELRQLNTVISSRGAQVGDTAADPQLVAYRQNLTQLETELSHWTTLRTSYYAEYICQMYGAADCPAKGSGADTTAVSANLLLASQQVTSYQAQVSQVQEEIQQREQLLSSTTESSQQQRYEEALTQRPVVQAEFDAATQRRNQLYATYGAYQQASSRGILIRLAALSELSTGGAAIAGPPFLLFLLFSVFLVIECLPVTVKWLQRPGQYELALQAARAAERRDYQKSLITGTLPPVLGMAEAAALVVRERGPERISQHATSEHHYYPGGSGSSGKPPHPGGGARQRYLQGQYPESTSVGEPFPVQVSVVLAAVPGGAALESFEVPPAGRDVRIQADVPAGLRVLGHRLLTVRVPEDRDSKPVMFELCADVPGVRTVSVTAWIDGSFLGELRIDITAEHGRPAGRHRHAMAPITTDAVEGAVSLTVRFDPLQRAYRFEFHDEDYPGEVTSNLAYEPGPRVEQLITSLEALAKGRSGHQAGQVRAHLMNSGAALWHELVPRDLREQFWERQGRIRQLTIVADNDAVPWELLYPMDPGHNEGFLVEQFPVTRGIFGQRMSRKLSLWPVWFVLPGSSLPGAQAEIDAIRVSLSSGNQLGDVISEATPLQNLIASGDFGLLHFACHNVYDPVGGSSIKFGSVPFTPTDLTAAAINKVLARSAPTVFINACRSAGLTATYNRLDGWATKFLEAGAAAFIGSLWAVSDGAAREFAEELYGQLQSGSSLGQAVTRARTAAAGRPDDPTWLAYAVYGDPRATLGQERP